MFIFVFVLFIISILFAFFILIRFVRVSRLIEHRLIETVQKFFIILCLIFFFFAFHISLLFAINNKQQTKA